MRGIGAALLILTASCAPTPSLKSRAEGILTLDRNGGHDPDPVLLSKLASGISRSELAPEKLRTYDIRTLEMLFEALEAEHDKRVNDRQAVESLEAVFDELLIGRHGYVFDFPKRIFQIYIGQRDWSKARALYDEIPEKELKLPVIEEPAISTGPAVYEVSADGGSMRLRPVDLAAKPMILAVVGCHFADDALQGIAADPELADLFKTRALIIDPSFFALNTADIADANRVGPFHYTILHKPAGWPIEFNRSPSFFLIRDGAVAAKLIGWYGKETLDGLRAWVKQL